MTTRREAILVTGGTGYVGCLVLSVLLRETDADLILPVRGARSPDDLRALVRGHLALEGHDAGAVDFGRLVVTPLPATGRMDDLAAADGGREIREVVHTAGCSDYQDAAACEAANVGLTAALLAAAKRMGVGRFVHISTMFCSGLTDGVIPERLHPPGRPQPIHYTETKRRAEWLVAESGIPFVIVRPSVVVGHSRAGWYRGKPFGMYQVNAVVERTLCAEYLPVLHLLSTPNPLPFLHQDAFQLGFSAIRRRAPDGAVVHLVSRAETLPRMEEFWKTWIEEVLRPREVRTFRSLEEAAGLDAPHRTLYAMAGINIGIAARPWRPETTTIDRLRGEIPDFPDVTPESFRNLQRRAFAESAAVQAFRERFAR